MLWPWKLHCSPLDRKSVCFPGKNPKNAFPWPFARFSPSSRHTDRHSACPGHMFLELAKITTATIDRYEKEFRMKALFQKLCAAGVLLLAAPVGAQSPVIWTGSWAASPMAATAGEVTIGDPGITFRNFIHLSIGGQAVRIRLSNEYGTKPLLVADVHLARSASEGAIVAGS